MNYHDLEKYQLEKSAMDLFIEIYNKNFENQLRIFQKQERPDFLLLDSEDNQIGMEIAHVFYDPLEAQILLNRSSDIRRIEYFNNFKSEFNKVLINKCKKREKFICNYPCSLLIKNTSEVFTSEDIKKALQSISSIPNNQYKDIWVLSRNNMSLWVIMKIDL